MKIFCGSINSYKVMIEQKQKNRQFFSSDGRFLQARSHIYSFLNPNVLYLHNATVWYYSRVLYYLNAYKHLYVISFLFFDNVAIVSRMTLLFTTSDNVAR